MLPIHTTQEVFADMNQAKADAEYCTNFYPARPKLETWIARGELNGQHCGETTFFLRKDRDFWHLYFCAPNVRALRRDLCALPELKTERVVADVLGTSETLEAMMPAMKNAGLRHYKHLVRMARTDRKETTPSCDSEWTELIVLADRRDAGAFLDLIAGAFDRYAKQLPLLHEIETAAEASQVLLLRRGNNLAGSLLFETRGVMSTLRFWAVAEPFRELRVGSALMRHYLTTQKAVRRFVLWVNADNKDTIEKYRHYHYATDGVVDYVLANDWIPR